MNPEWWHIYLLAGVLWGMFSVKMQVRLYGKHTPGWAYPFLFLFNLAIWPASLFLALLLAPVTQLEQKKPRYVR